MLNEKNITPNQTNKELVEDYEKISYSTLTNDLSSNKSRYEYYHIKTLKSHFERNIPEENSELYKRYIEPLVEVNNKSNYEENLKEYLTNFNYLFEFIKDLVKNEVIYLQTMSKAVYNYLIHNATIALISEWNKYQAVKADKIARSRITRC